MAQRHILADKTELILNVEGKKKFEMVHLTYDQIVRIQFDRIKEFKLFFRVDSEAITIVSSKRGPIVFKKTKEKNFFEEYKQVLEKFCKDNRVTFTNNLTL
jgi:hypothetical protein